ncbi:MAG TPA: hypothetical protein VFI23_10340 [Rhizomicrobium sp.]|nr:hypothetical protein [Rhizomicrobium sp.]
MAKTSPEKLAKALRANLKRRKQAEPASGAQTPPKPAAPVASKPPKSPAKTEN